MASRELYKAVLYSSQVFYFVAASFSDALRMITEVSKVCSVDSVEDHLSIIESIEKVADENIVLSVYLENGKTTEQ